MSHRPHVAPAASAEFAWPATALLPWRAHVHARRLASCALLIAAGLLGSTPAWAQVVVNQILFPSNIGRALDATVSIDATRTGSAAGNITVALPPQLTASAPPAASGCALTGSPATAVVCTVPAGNASDRVLLNFDVRGLQLGSFNLGAVTATSSASNTGTVRESGDVTVQQSRLPTGNPVIGQSVVFSIGPRIAAGGDALPSGAVLTLTGQLPGLSANFSVTGINSGINSGMASCNSAALVDSTRTLSCSIAGPLTVAEVNAISITVTGTHGSSGNFVNVVSVAAQPSAYIDQDGSNNTSNLAYTVGTGTADVEARGSFIGTPVATGSTQTLTLTFLNNGPSALPSGGRISTTLAAGLRVNSLPPGCSGPAAGVVLTADTALNCGTGALNIGESQNFVVPLTMPLAAASGSFVVNAELPAGYADSVPANNTLTLPWQAVVLGTGQAQVTLAKSSSADGSTWVDDPGTPPTITSANGQMRWRILITTPAAAPQSTIGTLTLTDAMPGVLSVASPGAPAPGYQTPQITVVTSVPAGSATGACPNVMAGNNLLVCNFFGVAPGTTIQVLVTVNRPFFAAPVHLNTATLSSPDAVLSGTVSDAAALETLPRTDLAANGLTVTPATPRVGQPVQFTLTAQNLGPDQNEIGEFKMISDLNTSTAGATVAYGDILASGSGMTCALAGTALSDEPALPAGHVRVRCINTTAVVARYSTRTVTIGARVLKPASLPSSGNAFLNQSNTLRVQLPIGVCEFKTETSSNPQVSGACSDAAAFSNNAVTVNFNVALPLVDLQQRATRVLPAGQASFSFGQPLRYRLRMQNNGPSRAEAVQMSSVLTVPAGFTLSNPLVLAINGSAAETGYVLDNSKTSTVSCSQAGANANLVCVLSSSASNNWLDAGREVNFEVEFTQTGRSSTPVNFGNEALVCGAESTPFFETFGACNRAAVNNNNLAAVNDVIFPRTDLSVTKTTVTALPVAVNQPVVFNLVVRNGGADATQRIRLQDVLPANFELITSGPNAPSLALGAFVTAAPSTATGGTLACTPTPAALAGAGQVQTVNCLIDAAPGALGSGAFPGSSNASNTLTVRLVAVPRAGLFTGPYLSPVTNTATVQPGLDASGNPLSIDEVPGNNSSGSTVQVASSSLAGRVFNDRNGNGLQDGSSPVQDEGIGGVTLALTGTDVFGNAINRSTSTQAAAGSTRGDYAFNDLPPGTYTVTQMQPSGWLNGAGTPPAPSNGGTYTAAASASTSTYTAVTLAAGAAATGYSFPEALPASVVSGTVFFDRDRNGMQGPGEPGISGATLGLYPAGTNCPASGALPANPLQTVLTDATGVYAFASAPPGVDYVACLQPPSGYGSAAAQPGSGNSTPGATQINVVALPASGSPGNQFPQRLGSISGTVFVDLNTATPATNGNGARDAGEPGLGSATAGAGVLVTLSGTLAGSGAAVTPQTTTSAQDGSFSFGDLLAGTYTLTEGSTPAALGVFNDGINTAGSVTLGGTPGSAGAVGDNAIRNIVLPGGADSPGNTFAELPATAISGLVYVDRNQDGVLTAADPGRLAGVSIELRRGGSNCASASLLGSTSTAADGSFTFPGGSVTAAQVSAGLAYRICQLQPAGYADGSTTPGAGGSTPAPNEVLVASLPASGSSGTQFGERAASLAGRVFLDAANDGLFNGSDSGIPAVVLTLTGGSLPPSGTAGTTATTATTAITAADGSYRFDDLPAGSYDLVQAAAQPTVPVGAASVTTLNGQTRAGSIAGAPVGTATPVANVPSAVRSIVLPAGAAGSGYDFAEILPAQVSGSVYTDANNNGTRQPTEGGYPNQTVVLTGIDDLGRAVNLPATTDVNGNFSLPDLRPGSYTLTQPVQPPGSSNGITTPGSAGGTATPVSSMPSAISGITLVPGLSSTGNLFGESSSAPDMVVTQTLTPTTFTELNTGSYTLTVANAGQVPTVGSYTVTDTLPPGISTVGLPRGTGWACSVSGQVLTCSSSTPILAASTSGNQITVDVTVTRNACAAFPCTLTNVVSVAGGGEPATSAPTPAELAAPPQCTAQATQNVCNVVTPVQQSGGVSGTVWLDVDHDRMLTSADVRQPGFVVELLLNGQLQRSATTDARGDYMLTGLVPGNGYEVRFKDPATGAYYGRPLSADPAGGNDPAAFGPTGVVPGGSIQNLSIPGGNAMRVNQNLPLDPNGVVYDSASRQPVAGAVVELLTPNGDPVPAQCVLGGVNRITTATTAAGGVGAVPGGYAFWLANPQPAGCAGNGVYQLRVTPPTGYLNAGRPSDGSLQFTSVLLPATSNLASVPVSCQGYVAGGACAIQVQAAPPTGTQPTPYYFRLPLTPATPLAFVEIVNNHIPLDPFGGTRFVITKQAAARSADVGDTMRYTITVRHVDGPQLPNVRVDDALPAGFRYIPGTFRVGATLQSDPAGSPGPTLRFPLGTLPVNGQVTLTYFLRVGVGAQQGDGVNTAQGISVSGTQQLVSNIARAKVKVTGGVFSTEACVVGKVYVDCNGNMVQDREELGIPGVRLLLQDGTGITTDSEGKYSHCGLPPRTQVLKVDPLTLPRGARLVTSSSRNAGDANSLFLDLKNGELQRADFIEGSCSNTVLEQVKARRAQGEVRAVDSEAKGTPALKFEGKAPGYPQQGTDSANQPPVKPRVPASETDPPPAPVQPSRPEQNVPVPQLPAASQNTQRK